MSCKNYGFFTEATVFNTMFLESTRTFPSVFYIKYYVSSVFFNDEDTVRMI